MAKVLVVDDVRELAETTAELLEALGHEARVAYDGRQAFELARVFEPHVVFMDLDMPVLGGLEAAKLIRARIPAPPYLVAITAGARRGMEEESRDAGFDQFLAKPTDVDVLLSIVETAVARQGR